ncbi:unnamed protein product [Schistocephalus solidus]|uniref:G_PROTEIN_RECEP_F1_2 domain-containing protein n=1 Tax=Schistocephalus solidus TaxID=70667 RepID=A0A183SMK8_SCHSO|nr:unnamed protein product [Schistocephalus solidus]
MAGNFDLLAADPRDFHLPTEVLLSIYGHEYFSSHRTLWVRNCLIVLYCIFSAVGVLMNVCVVSLLIAWHQKALRNITNTFVLALASSDIVMSGFNMPMQTFYELMETVPFSEVTCRIVFSTFGLPMHISCLVILIIGIDRYWIIIYPLRRRMTRLTAAGMLIIIITISLISVIPIAVFSTSSPAAPMPNASHYRYCVEYWPSPEVRLVYSIMTFLVQFLLPLVLTATLYGRIYIRLHERRFRKRDLERKKRTNKILVGIVVCFFVCWTPWTVFSLTLEVHTYWTQKDFQNGSLQQEAKEAPAPINTVHLQKLLLSCLQGLQKQQLNGVVEMGALAACPDYNTTVLAPESLLLFGRHTKLIDLVLKLLAMCSSCLNPCLYGCMTETMRMIMKKTVRRMHNFHNWISKLHGSGPVSAQVSSTNKCDRQKMSLFENYRSNSFAVPVYVMQCCGFQFVIRTGFHQQHEQVRKLLEQKEGTEVCAENSTPGGKAGQHLQHAQRRQQYRSRCPGTGVLGTGLATGFDAQTTSGSGKKHFLQSVNETHQLGGGVGVPADKKAVGSDPANGDKDHRLYLQQLDPACLSFIDRGSGTLSVTEQSTKRTSLLPSSVTEKTPRNSFLVVKVNSARVESSAELNEIVSECKLQTTANVEDRGVESLPVSDQNHRIANSDSQPVIVVCEVSSTNGDETGTPGCFDSIEGPTLIKKGSQTNSQSLSAKRVYDELIPQLAGAEMTTDCLPHLKLVNIEVHVEDAAAAIPSVHDVTSHIGPMENMVDSPTESYVGDISSSKSEPIICPIVSTEPSSGITSYVTSIFRSSLVRNFKVIPNNLAPLEEISGYATSNDMETSASDGRGSVSSSSRGVRKGNKPRSGKQAKCTFRRDESSGAEHRSSRAEKVIFPVSAIVTALLPKSTSIIPGRNLWRNVKRRSMQEPRQKRPMQWKRSQSITSTSYTFSQKSSFKNSPKAPFKDEMLPVRKSKELEETEFGFDPEKPDCSQKTPKWLGGEVKMEKVTRFQRESWKERDSTCKSDESSDDFAYFHKLALQEAMQNVKGSIEDRRRSYGPSRHIMHLGRRISLPWLLRSESCRKDHS